MADVTGTGWDANPSDNGTEVVLTTPLGDIDVSHADARTIAAMLVETVVQMEGGNVPPDDLLKAALKALDAGNANVARAELAAAYEALTGDPTP